MKHGSAQGTRKRSPLRNIRARHAGLAFGGVVAAVAATTSYTHMHDLAAEHGQGWLSWLVPVSVDALLIIASLAIVEARRAGSGTPWLAWVALVAGVGASLVANIASAEPGFLSRAIAAWSPLAFAAAFELVLQVARSERGRPTDEVAKDAAEPVVELDDEALKERAREIYQQEPGISDRKLAGRLGVSRYRAGKALDAITAERRAQIRAVGGER